MTEEEFIECTDKIVVHELDGGKASTPIPFVLEKHGAGFVDGNGTPFFRSEVIEWGEVS